MNQWDFTAPFEGVVPHMYLDSRGFVTAGVGFMFPNLQVARSLAWTPPGEVDLDWIAVTHLPPAQPAKFYQRHTTARLSEAVMREEFARRIDIFQKSLTVSEPQFRTWPEPIRVAVLDMVYNLGLGGFLKYKNLLTDCRARRWDLAAGECNRRGVQTARNEATRAIFQKQPLDT